MLNVNLGRENPLTDDIKATLRTLIKKDEKESGASIINGEEAYINRVLDLPIPLDLYQAMKPVASRIGVTPAFRDVIDYFKVPDGETPAGFRMEYILEANFIYNPQEAQGHGCHCATLEEFNGTLYCAQTSKQNTCWNNHSSNLRR